MNVSQITLFNDLNNLVDTNEAFYFQTFESNGHIYRIYNYRLASYTDFSQPSALEARGVMFEVDAAGGFIELKSLPMFKFFNAYENPFVMDLDFSAVDSIFVKADGSLMSTYEEDGQLKLKSKGSISSEQALCAMELLSTQLLDLKDVLHRINGQGYTVNLEYTSPIHRIVLGYPDPGLTVLSARSRVTGEYVPYDTLVTWFGESHVIERIQDVDTKAFCEDVPNMVGIEGFVVWLVDGRIVKLKCDWYKSLHFNKESVNTPRRLFEAILDEGVDDLRSMFHTDPIAIGIIDDMQQKVDTWYNHAVKTVSDYYEANRQLDRKGYAIKGQQELPQHLFGLAMNLYVGHEVDYKAWMKSKYKLFGISDTAPDQG